MANTIYEEQKLLGLRKKIFIAGYKGGMAHLASCYSSLEMLYAFYIGGILRIDKKNPSWSERDRLILSKGHAGLALYVVLEEAGLITEGTVTSYLTEDSMIGGEPCMRDCAFVEAATGSLGHGLSMAAGMALGFKLDDKPAKVYCILGDGECEEGTVWEAAMSASSYRLDNLAAIIDCNRIQKMDFVNNIIGNDNWEDKWKSFGWNVVRTDGHDISKFKETVMTSFVDDKPTVIIADTIKGKGVSVMENSANWHFRLPNRKELKIFMEELKINDTELI